MIAYELTPPIEAWGQHLKTLDEAAYVVRQFAIESNNSEARKLVRLMRDAQTVQEATVAESRLRAWLLTVSATDSRLLQMSASNGLFY